MIEVDNFWNLKTFKAVLANLLRSWDEVICEHENEFLHCTENDKTNGDLDENSRILSIVQTSFWSCTHVNSCQKYTLYINLHILLNILS